MQESSQWPQLIRSWRSLIAASFALVLCACAESSSDPSSVNSAAPSPENASHSAEQRSQPSTNLEVCEAFVAAYKANEAHLMARLIAAEEQAPTALWVLSHIFQTLDILDRVVNPVQHPDAIREDLAELLADAGVSESSIQFINRSWKLGVLRGMPETLHRTAERHLPQVDAEELLGRLMQFHLGMRMLEGTDAHAPSYFGAQVMDVDSALQDFSASILKTSEARTLKHLGWTQDRIQAWASSLGFGPSMPCVKIDGAVILLPVERKGAWYLIHRVPKPTPGK